MIDAFVTLAPPPWAPGLTQKMAVLVLPRRDHLSVSRHGPEMHDCRNDLEGAENALAGSESETRCRVRGYRRSLVEGRYSLFPCPAPSFLLISGGSGRCEGNLVGRQEV